MVVKNDDAVVQDDGDYDKMMPHRGTSLVSN